MLPIPQDRKGFLLQCSLYFSGQEGVPEHTKIIQIINLLTHKALVWATTLWFQGGEHMAFYKHFLQLFQLVFDPSEGPLRATRLRETEPGQPKHCCICSELPHIRNWKWLE